MTSWLGLCEKLAFMPADYYSGVQKIIHHQSIEIQVKKIGEIDYYGYSEKGNKIKALRKHYLDEDSIQNAANQIQEIVRKNRYGSAGFSMRGDEKKWTKQDFCIQASVVTHVPGNELELTVFYRTTEVIKKFAADLVFIKEVVLPYFNDVSYNVNFYFNNVTVHPMFFPILLAHEPQPVEFLKSLKANDNKFFVGVGKWMQKYLFEGNTSWVQNFSQARQIHQAMIELTSEQDLKDIKEYFNEILC